jgi:hypothetical protein
MRTCDSLHSLRTTQIQQATCDTIGSRPSGTRTSARATRSTTCSSRMGSRGCCGSHVVSHVPCCALYGAWLIRIRSAPISATPDVRQPPHSPHTHAQHTHARTRYAHGTDEVARAHAPHMCLGVVHAVNGASICRRARIAHALLLLRALCLAQGCMADWFRFFGAQPTWSRPSPSRSPQKRSAERRLWAPQTRPVHNSRERHQRAAIGIGIAFTVKRRYNMYLKRPNAMPHTRATCDVKRALAV